MEESIKNLKNKLKTEKTHDFESLCELVRVLRSPEGCVWDTEQTHKSIRCDIIEETYDVVEAIDKDDMTLLREELGDVLFQVMFHTRIEEERGTFTINDVIGDICDKMILRHPHVFGDVDVENSAEVLENWEKIKKVEKSRVTVRENMESVPRQLPSLMRARKIIKKARKDGYEFADGDALSAKIHTIADSVDMSDEASRKAAAGELVFMASVLAGDSADLEKDLGDRINAFIESYPEKEQKNEA